MKKWQEMSRFFYKILKNFIAVRPGSAGERGWLENPSGALHPFRPAVAGLWECARVLASLFLLLNPCQYLDSEVVWYVDPIGLERINGSHKRRSRVGFKPGRRTPRILIGQRHQSVFHRVLMHIIQPRMLSGFLKRQASIPKFVHDSPAGSSIHAVELYRQFAV